jgi:hypothetical protein
VLGGARVSKVTEDLGRLAVTPFVKRVIEAEKAATGESEQEIVRRVVDGWARGRHRAFKVYARALKADGLQMELDGIETGDDVEPSGRRK